MGAAARTYIFAGGGTGGHLYPGLAIAERIRERDAGAEVLFLCSDKGLDAKLLSAEGAAFEAIPARPLSMRPMGLVRLISKWGECVRRSRAVIRRVRAAGREAHVIAMGGYVAAPAAQAARAERAALTLVNLDATPGKANRWIARKAGLVVTAAAVEGFEDWRRIPPVVRRAAKAVGTPAMCREKLGLDPSRLALFVTGASQGSRSINELMMAVAASPEGRKALRGWQVFHQTGDVGEQVEAVRAGYAAAGVAALVEPYCADMASAWGAAELAVSRCGAGSVAEVWANGVPTVFLPYPYHRDQHQKLNARPLGKAGAAVIEDDQIDPRANMEKAGKTIVRLLSDSSDRSRMRGAFRPLGPADGAEKAAEAIVSRV